MSMTRPLARLAWLLWYRMIRTDGRMPDIQQKAVRTAGRRSRSAVGVRGLSDRPTSGPSYVRCSMPGSARSVRIWTYWDAWRHPKPRNGHSALPQAHLDAGFDAGDAEPPIICRWCFEFAAIGDRLTGDALPGAHRSDRIAVTALESRTHAMVLQAVTAILPR